MNGEGKFDLIEYSPGGATLDGFVENVWGKKGVLPKNGVHNPMKHDALPGEKEILLFNITFTVIFDPTNMIIARIALSGETFQQ